MSCKGSLPSLALILSLGEVYEAIDIINVIEVAVKLEPIDCKRSNLEHEVTVYKHLSGSSGIPRAHWFGAEDGYDALVLDLLGPSLDAVVSRGCPLGLKTVITFGEEMVRTPLLGISGHR